MNKTYSENLKIANFTTFPNLKLCDVVESYDVFNRERYRGDHAYSQGKWGYQINIHNESILPKEPRPFKEELTKEEKMKFYQCVTKCCHCYNTIQNFGLHSIPEPSLVLYIVITNFETHSLSFLKEFFPLCKVCKMPCFHMLDVTSCI